MTAAHKAAKAWYDARAGNDIFVDTEERREFREDMVRRLTGHLEPYFKAEVQPLIEALAAVFEEYDNQQSQYGSEYLWKKHEDREAIEKARLVLDKYVKQNWTKETNK